MGYTWEKWAEMWCKWFLSIPKEQNPCLDNTGEHCSIDQNNESVWFLAGTFGNTVPVIRKCRVPKGKAFFLPILEKQDSLANDLDLNTDYELIERAKNATDKVLHMEAAVDGQMVENLEKYRARSEVFDFVYRENNVYDVKPGPTRSVCDGFWLFVRPMSIGYHTIYFSGETSLVEPNTLEQMKASAVYDTILQHIISKLTFKIEVYYLLTVS